MSVEVYLKEKISKTIFLNVEKDTLENIFGVHDLGEVYLPIRSEFLVDKISEEYDFEEIEISEFIESMAFIVSCDESFPYSEKYILLLKSDKVDAVSILKKKASFYIKSNMYEEGYILAKALTFISDDEDIVRKSFELCEEIRKKNKIFNEELRKIITKFSYTKYSFINLYHGLLLLDGKKYEEAHVKLKKYYDETYDIEVHELLEDVSYKIDYEKGKGLIFEKPVEALKLLLPLVSAYSENAELFYFIGICYRLLNENNEAIKFLEKSIIIKHSQESINELGLNYAALHDYDKAIEYFRENFEMTKSIEVCTNLIMCYININDIENAKLHMEIGKKIDKDDEILLMLEKHLGG